MVFKNLKLGTKQILGFGFILVILAATNIFSLMQMAAVKNEIDEVSTNWMPRAVAISEININALELRNHQLQHALAREDTTKEALAEFMIPLIDRINMNLDTYDSLKAESEARGLYSQPEGRLYERFLKQWEEYQDISLTFFMLSRDNKRQQAIELLNTTGLEIFNNASRTMSDLVKANKEDAAAAAVRAEMTFRRTRNLIRVLVFGTVLLSIFIAGTLVRLIVNPVRQLEKAAREVSAGNLNVQVDIPSTDEIGNLALSFNQMTTSLKAATEKMERQAEAMREQNQELEFARLTLEKQKTEIEQKNVELQNALNELKTTQNHLLMKEKMAALGDLVAGVAHELNNPIGAVNSITDVSNRCLDRIEIVLEQSQSIEEIRNNPDLTKTLTILRDNIKVTLTAGNRIATIVKSLKNFARLDESNYKRVDLHEGLDSSLILLESELRGRIRVEKEYGDLPMIACYPGQLNQVFINLLKNAIQAMGDNGVIKIRTCVEDGSVRIEIADNGHGIPTDRLAHIFDFEFEQEGERVKLGYGLKSAFNIIQNHNGDIKIESEVGKGTTVSVNIPIT